MDHGEFEMRARVVDRQAPALGHDDDHECCQGEQAFGGG